VQGRALVVDDGASFTGLAAVRGLAVGGHRVGLASSGSGPSWSSRAVAERWRLPPLAAGSAAFVAAVSRAAASYDVVLPTGDAELLALSAARAQVPARLGLPEHAQVVRALDKRGLTAAGAAAGLRVPREVALADLPDDPSLRWAVKPRLHEVGAPAVTRVVRGPAEVLAAVDDLHATGAQALVQEAFTGDLVAYVALVREGRVVGALQQRASALWPPSAGNCVRGRCEPVDPDLAAGAARLLADLCWDGIVQLELVAPAGERPGLVDLNGRVYGSMALALGAGLNLPALYVDQVLGAPDPEPVVRLGARYSALGLDLRRALSGPAPVRGVLGCLPPAVGAAHPLWSPTDPLPALRWTAGLLRRIPTRSGS